MIEMVINGQEVLDIYDIRLRTGDLFLVTKWIFDNNKPERVLLAEFDCYTGGKWGFNARNVRWLYSDREKKQVDNEKDFFYENERGYHVDCYKKECYTQDRILEVLKGIKGMQGMLMV